jgi:Flp pilus assembly protein TadD
MEKAARKGLVKSGLVNFLVLFILSFFYLSYIYAANIGGVAGDAESYRTKGYEAQQRGDIDTAIEWYQKAANISPGYASPHNDLGILFETKGWLDRAEAEYEKALAIDPSYKEVHTNLALLYERKGELEKAAFHWMRRYKLGSPEDPWTQEARSRLEKLGLLDKTEKPVPLKASSVKIKGLEEKEKPVPVPVKVKKEPPLKKQPEKKLRPEARPKKASEWTRVGPEKKAGEGFKSSSAKLNKSLDAELQESLRLAEERLRKEKGAMQSAKTTKKQAEAKAASAAASGSNASYNKARDYYNKGEYTKALDTIRSARQNYPGDKQLLGMEDEIRFRMKEERIEDHHKEGMLRYRQKDFTGARKEYEAILSILPE